MPAVKIKPKSSSSSSSSSSQSRVAFVADEVATASVLIIVEGETIEVYTGKEADLKLAE
jgi:hypothetical protein